MALFTWVMGIWIQLQKPQRFNALFGALTAKSIGLFRETYETLRNWHAIAVRPSFFFIRPVWACKNGAYGHHRITPTPLLPPGFSPFGNRLLG